MYTVFFGLLDAP